MAKKSSNKNQSGTTAPKDERPKDEVEMELEKAVFGDMEGFEKGLEAALGEDQTSSSEEEDIVVQEEIPDRDLFVIDQDMPGLAESQEEREDSESVISSSPEPAAWIDSDDERLAVSLSSVKRLRKLRHDVDEDVISGKEYTRRLRNHFIQIYPVPEWAIEKDTANEGLSGGEKDPDMMDIDDGEDIVQHHADPLKKVLESTSVYTTRIKTGEPLPPTNIDILRLNDANVQQVAHSGIQTISFHPTLPLILTGGFDRTLRIFHVDGKENNLVSSLHLRNLPIQTSEFLSTANRVLISGRRRFMYLWDLESGSVDKVSRLYGHESHQKSFEKFKSSPQGGFVALCGSGGWVNILSGDTCQWICGCKIEGSVADVAWINEDELVIANGDSDLWVYNVPRQSVTGRWSDSARIATTTISCSSKSNVNGIVCAVGTQSGIVSMYYLATTTNNNNNSINSISPTHTFDQLVTPVSSLCFSPDGQILAMASRAKRDSLRLVHTGTATVFRNWPTSNTPLGRVTALGFSPSNHLIAIGNDSGKTRLYRFNHYV